MHQTYTQNIHDTQDESRAASFDAKIFADRIRRIVGKEKTKKICIQAIRTSITEQGQVSPIELAQILEAQFIRLNKCACGECMTRHKMQNQIARATFRIENGITTLPAAIESEKESIERYRRIATNSICNVSGS